MYNSDLPNRAELPSSGQLLRSTAIAIVTAALLLVTTILPAEYGIDPTGVGRMMGLKQMGEIKISLAEEAEITAIPPVEVAVRTRPRAENGETAVSDERAAADSDMVIGNNFDSLSFTLAPGAAAEIKLVMVEGAEVNYRWQSKGGKVNYDTHGDNASINYHGYAKGRNVVGDDGVLRAAFDGSHGWFWRNRSGATVTVSLDVNGTFAEIKRVM